MKALVPALLACALALPLLARADSKTDVISGGSRLDLKKALRPEGTTLLLFVNDTSVIEQQFVADVTKLLPADRVTLHVVKIKDTTALAAQQFNIKATPTALVYDRFGRLMVQTSQPDEIRAAIRKGQQMARIKWIDEDDPRATEVYGAPPAALQRGLPGIVKTMALRTDAFKMFNIISDIHFNDGFLKRREHEMVAAYVSALNKCKF